MRRGRLIVLLAIWLMGETPGFVCNTNCNLRLARTASRWGGVALAQEQPNYEQLKSQYDAAVKQMELGQERRNQLAKEADDLKARLADTSKQLEAAREQIDAMRRDAAQWQDRTFFYRAHYAAWRLFIQNYPELLGKWDAMMRASIDAPSANGPEFLQEDWPFDVSEQHIRPRTPATTMPTTSVQPGQHEEIAAPSTLAAPSTQPSTQEPSKSGI